MNVTVLLSNGQTETFRDAVPQSADDDAIVTAVVHECSVVDRELLRVTRVTYQSRMRGNHPRDTLELDREVLASYGPGEWADYSETAAEA